MHHIFFLIRSLHPGGAERQLIELAKGLDKARFHVTVATFYDGGELDAEIEGIAGITSLSLGKRGRWDVVPFMWRLWRAVLDAQPDILHGYMGVANELCLLLGKLLGRRVVWGLRASNMDFSRYDRMSSWVFKVGAWLSRFPDLIIVNSEAGRAHHMTHGYCGAHMIVIPNGIDTKRYFPDPHAGRCVRAEWGVADDETLIGLVGRLDPMKDHPTFLRAAGLLVQERADVRFVCVGDGSGLYQGELLALSQSLGLGRQLIWAGLRHDMPAVYNALDILTSSSYGEGFSNVIGEAMACGVPCVVTDVGDSARIVGETGMVVPPGDPEALAVAWRGLLKLPEDQRVMLTRAACERIKRNFRVSYLINKTEATLTSASKSDFNR
jgi:glycosyltransferase involved in cell wall biosynthesis